MSDIAEGQEPAPQPKSAPADRATAGPFDVSETNAVRPYVDFGALKIIPREGLHLRLEIEESTSRVVAVGLDYANSSLQVQPFAAPRSSGLWHEIREQLAEQVSRQGGTVRRVEGPFGQELFAEIPAPAQGDGAPGRRIARFVGVDGPRWFLRGVIAGEGAVSTAAAAKVEDLFRSLVVVRGGTPMPPRDLLPLKMPAQGGGQPGGAAPAPGAPRIDASAGARGVRPGAARPGALDA